MQKPLTPAEERAILSRIPRNPEAFRMLYRHYFPRVFAYVACRVGTKQEAEDLTATVFLNVIQAIAGFEYRGENAFAAWLFRIAHNAIQQSYRQDRYAIVPLDDLPEIESAELPLDEALTYKENFAQLHKALNTLSPRRREIITLRFFGGLRNQEIAEILSLDERTIASHLCRGLEDLKHAVESEELAHEPHESKSSPS